MYYRSKAPIQFCEHMAALELSFGKTCGFSTASRADPDSYRQALRELSLERCEGNLACWLLQRFLRRIHLLPIATGLTAVQAAGGALADDHEYGTCYLFASSSFTSRSAKSSTNRNDSDSPFALRRAETARSKSPLYRIVPVASSK